MKTFTLLALFGATSMACAQPRTRWHEFTDKFKSRPDQAKVIGAGYFGGAGTEWFSSGGFAPDGTIVAAGVTLGPELNVGVPVQVLGTDTPAPPAPERISQMRNGKPVTDKEGNPKYDLFGWNHPNATAFVARFSPDLKRVISVSRLPWKSASLTGAAVDTQGNIYITGPATEAVTALSPDTKELAAPAEQNKGDVNHIYLAKLAPDASRILWVRHLKAASPCPSLRVDKNGKIVLTGPDFRTFNANGAQESVATVPGGLTGNVAVNPIDGTFARGGEHHWPTGREPYRDPILNIYKPGGDLLYQLYDWPGPYVGLDNLRLVSDTAIRGVAYDDEGNLLLHVWSDGGNSVMQYQPNDVRRAHGAFDRGTGFSIWGANVLSVAYIVRIETKNYKVANGTIWVGYLQEQNKPNSVMIHAMSAAPDGSICVAGDSAFGLIRTGNEISGGAPPTGPYVAVFSRELDSLRFCSNLPATSAAMVTGSQRWAIATGSVQGKPRALFFTGATQSQNMNGEDRAAPVVNAPQVKYGGGWLDGYLTVLDLS